MSVPPQRSLLRKRPGSRAALQSSKWLRPVLSRCHGNGHSYSSRLRFLPPPPASAPRLRILGKPEAEGRTSGTEGRAGPGHLPSVGSRLTLSDCSSSPWHRRLRKDFCSRHSVWRVVRNTVPPTFSRTHLPQPPPGRPPAPTGGAASPASILIAGRGVCILPTARRGRVPGAGHAGSCSLEPGLGCSALVLVLL